MAAKKYRIVAYLKGAATPKLLATPETEEEGKQLLCAWCFSQAGWGEYQGQVVSLQLEEEQPNGQWQGLLAALAPCTLL